MSRHLLPLSVPCILYLVSSTLYLVPMLSCQTALFCRVCGLHARLKISTLSRARYDWPCSQHTSFSNNEHASTKVLAQHR